MKIAAAYDAKTCLWRGNCKVFWTLARDNVTAVRIVFAWHGTRERNGLDIRRVREAREQRLEEAGVGFRRRDGETDARSQEAFGPKAEIEMGDRRKTFQQQAGGNKQYQTERNFGSNEDLPERACDASEDAARAAREPLVGIETRGLQRRR